MNRIVSFFSHLTWGYFLRLLAALCAVLAVLFGAELAHAEPPAPAEAKATAATEPTATTEPAATTEPTATTEPAAPEPNAASASAAPTTPTPEEAPASSAQRSITLKLTLGDSTLGADAIERAIEEELATACEQTIASADLELTLGGGRVVARAKASGGRVIERSMTLPPTEEEQLQVIALLSENLLRDEAGAILSDLPEDSTPAAPPVGVAITISSIPAAPPAAPKEDTGPFWPVGISFTRDLGLPGKKANVGFALALPDAQWRSLQGLGIAGVSQSWRAHSTGLAIAGVLHEGPAFDGLTIAGVYDAATDTEGSRRGLTIAGVYSRAAGEMLGLQIGGVMSGAGMNMRGLQIGGLMSTTGKSFTGLQIGGLMSEAKESMTGMQIAMFNSAGAAKYGMQIGVVNYADEGGAQIGVVNVRRKGDGPQIGLIGIGPETRMQLTSWVQLLNLEPLEGGMPSGPTANVGLRIQTKYVTSSVHLGFGAETHGCGPQNDCGTGAGLVIPGYTIGGRLPVSKVWSFELDVQHRIAAIGSIYEPQFLALRGSVVARVHPLLAFFAAAGPEFVFPTVSDTWVREHIALGVQVL